MLSLIFIGQTSSQVNENSTTSDLQEEEIEDIEIPKSDIREIIKLNFFNDLDDLGIQDLEKIKIEDDKDNESIGLPSDLKDIQREFEDLQDHTLCENIAGSYDVTDIVRHEVLVHSFENTEEISDNNQQEKVLDTVDIDREYHVDEFDVLLESDLSSPCAGFTDEEIVEAECRLETFKQIDAIFLSNYKEDMSQYACGTPTGKFSLYK